MRPIEVVAAGAVSPLGDGARAWDIGGPGERPVTLLRRDRALEEAGLARPIAARVAGLDDDPSRSVTLLARAASALAEELTRSLPGWRARRVGLAIGTSGGGMPALTHAFELVERGREIPRELARSAPYFGPLAALERALDIEPVERVNVLAACASSTTAIALASRWLDLDLADLVIAGGYDALSVFIAAGFEALSATTASAPAPFRAGRDGLGLGEGAALLALARLGEGGAERLGTLLGAGLASDAVHVTAPDVEGQGLAAAASVALADAAVAPETIALVSAHGTATPYNDAAETRALERVLGARARDVVVHPHKAVIGHCLGAGGALELLAALDALRRGLAPAACGVGDVDPALGVRLLERNEPAQLSRCLKLSAAFGGADAALVIGPPEAGALRRPRREVALLAVGDSTDALDLTRAAGRLAVAPARLARLDSVSRRAVGAAASALEQLGAALPERAGVVVGTATATLEIDAVFDARRRSRGARFVEPRRFPSTSPNLAPGACSIAFGLRGPALAVGWGPWAAVEALRVGYDLVSGGDADLMVVVAAEERGAVVERLWSAAGWPMPEPGAIAAVLGVGSAGRDCVSRASLTAAEREFARPGGSAEVRPGWPSLRAALERATKPCSTAAGSGTVPPPECASPRRRSTPT